jgi:hypothetical protein
VTISVTVTASVGVDKVSIATALVTDSATVTVSVTPDTRI